MSKDSTPSSISSRRETRANLDLTTKDMEELSDFVNTRRPVRRSTVLVSRTSSLVSDLSETFSA